MIKVKNLIDLKENEIQSLQRFLINNEENLSPYHTVEFAKVIDETFQYENCSLTAFDGDDCLGYLPQWRKGNLIESIPWRDKGGPSYDHEDILRAFIDQTKKIVSQLNLKGFLWKGFETELLENYKYFVNVRIDLRRYNCQDYWNEISSKVRGKINNAKRNGLVFKVENQNIEKAVESFYKLLITNRKRLGVPVYPKKLFEAYFRNIPQDQIKMFSIYNKESVISSFILLHNRTLAIDAYSASDDTASKLKANDMLIYNIIIYCMDREIKYFDFGADSPLQGSLIDYKLKWLGKKQEIVTSFFGQVREIEHNASRYEFIKKMIRKAPMPVYSAFSRILVR